MQLTMLLLPGPLHKLSMVALGLKEPLAAVWSSIDEPQSVWHAVHVCWMVNNDHWEQA